MPTKRNCGLGCFGGALKLAENTILVLQSLLPLVGLVFALVVADAPVICGDGGAVFAYGFCCCAVPGLHFPMDTTFGDALGIGMAQGNSIFQVLCGISRKEIYFSWC